RLMPRQPQEVMGRMAPSHKGELPSEMLSPVGSFITTNRNSCRLAKSSIATKPTRAITNFARLLMIKSWIYFGYFHPQFHHSFLWGESWPEFLWSFPFGETGEVASLFRSKTRASCPTGFPRFRLTSGSFTMQ